MTGHPPRPAVYYARLVIPWAVFVAWITPALPLYGNDHERADFAP